MTLTGLCPQHDTDMKLQKERRKNNRKQTAGRYIQLASAYTADEVAVAQTSIEAARRARCLKNIQHHP